MSEVTMLQGVGPEQILQTAIEKKVPAIMTYLSKGKWHVAKVSLTTLSPKGLSIEGTRLEKKPHPINIRVNQPVGISFKYGYGKFVFDTTVAALEPSPDPASGGTIVLAVPDRIGAVQRRSYFRVEVPESLKVNVLLWHRSRNEAESDPCQQQAGVSFPRRQERDTTYKSRDYFHGRLVDISAGGAQVVIENQSETNPDTGQNPINADKSDFKKGQFVAVRFTPMPYEKPLIFNAQIRNVLPSADEKSAYLGLQIVGLEASPEGRKVLSRIVGLVERYFKINQSSAKQQDMKGALSAI